MMMLSFNPKQNAYYFNGDIYIVSRDTSELFKVNIASQKTYNTNIPLNKKYTNIIIIYD